MIITDEIKAVIESHTIGESMEILGLSNGQIRGLIYYHNLRYLYEKKGHKTEKTKQIIEVIKNGNKKQSEIAKEFHVSRQYVNQLKERINDES